MPRCTKCHWLLTLVIVALTATAHTRPARADDFALRDGDTVAFLGDSITAARGYTKIIEHYALMRYPDRKLRFYNAGKGGDTAQTSISRLQRDVFDRNATVMLVALGVNDIGWGARADQEHKQLYLDGIRTLIERCQEKGVRVIICSPAITGEPADRAERGFLQAMADEGLALAKSLDAGTIDVLRGMRTIQRNIETHNTAEPDAAKHVTLHAPDTIHLNDLGQLAMAFAILKGLGAPADVSSLALDAHGKIIEAVGCQASDVRAADGGLEFTRLDNGLPLDRGALSGLAYRWVPVPDQLNRYLLRIADLAPGDYTLAVDGRTLGKLSAAALATGVNVAAMTPDPWEPGGPWALQSVVVKELVDARDKLLMGESYKVYFNQTKSPANEIRQPFAPLDAQLTDLARQTARPLPYRFKVTGVISK